MKRKSSFCLSVLFPLIMSFGSLILGPSPVHGEGDGRLLWTRFELQDYAEDLSELLAAGYDVVERHPDESMVEIILSRSSYERLLARGYSGRILEVSRPYREIAGPDSPEEEYYDYEEIKQGLLDLESQYPAIAKRVDLTEFLSQPTTHEGRHIYALKVSDNVEQDEDEPAAVFECGHHARELVTHLIGMDIAERLTSQYGTDPQITRWVNRMEIWIVPAVNPDGLEYVWSHDQWWRKNRRDNGGGIYGVDNNRNYPYGWRVNGNFGIDPDDETYSGPAPGSEPENQTMMALWEHVVPVVMLDYHSYGDEVLDTYGYFYMPEPLKHDRIHDLLASSLDYSQREPASTGEAPEEAYHTYGVICHLIEVGEDFQPPFSLALQHVEHNRPGWRLMLNLLFLAPGVTGRVTDSVTGLPLVATYEIEEIDFQENEIRLTEPGHGRFIEVLPGDTTYHLTFSAENYLPYTITVPIGNRIVFRDVQLVPESPELISRTKN